MVKNALIREVPYMFCCISKDCYLVKGSKSAQDMSDAYLLSSESNSKTSIFLSNRTSKENMHVVDEWEIPIENIGFGELIGEGAFGKVYCAILSKIDIPHSQSSLALKTLSDGVEQVRKSHKGNESTTTVAVKTIQGMQTLFFIGFLETVF